MTMMKKKKKKKGTPSKSPRNKQTLVDKESKKPNENDNECWIKTSKFYLRTKDKNDIQNNQLLDDRVVAVAQHILK